MKEKRNLKRRHSFNLSYLLTFTVLFFGLSFVSLGQTEESEIVIPPPKSETFVRVDRLLMPLWGKECPAFASQKREPDCIGIVTFEEQTLRNNFTLYNADGSVWHQFQMSKYLVKEPVRGITPDRDDFRPILKDDQVMVRTVILWLVSESKYWFQVEVNRDKGETKYVLKSDSNWANSGWGNWLYKWPYLYLRKENRRLYDKPNGKITLEGESLRTDLWVSDVEGEWISVNYTSKDGDAVSGWIRYREGSNFLVGCSYNGFDGKHGERWQPLLKP